ncbi:MAG: hypothetical protein P8Y70_11110 [Candidatus Lokiarchaeota archaeon]
MESMQGDATTIENAIIDNKSQEQEIRKKIEDLKVEIANENEEQKELENSITLKQEKINVINTEITDYKSTLSSLNTEIKMNRDSIEQNINKKEEIKKKIQELSKGRELEAALKILTIIKQK